MHLDLGIGLYTEVGCTVPAAATGMNPLQCESLAAL
jgi:hypothetical protein